MEVQAEEEEDGGGEGRRRELREDGEEAPRVVGANRTWYRGIGRRYGSGGGRACEGGRRWRSGCGVPEGVTGPAEGEGGGAGPSQGQGRREVGIVDGDGDGRVNVLALALGHGELRPTTQGRVPLYFAQSE